MGMPPPGATTEVLALKGLGLFRTGEVDPTLGDARVHIAREVVQIA
jgi:hypothetical protein